ncbi:MAG: DUF3467 domain-containing protein [ANME-2 cluster archaeon]|nr:DUF3467 domain-containing protein [ANME-2 cluster archaeon]MBC2701198.1 DUF3467 domain-containing protein [ANME-2 cluster archaeon]MBC2707139.1 DUF3467 domain-containing protein [ANME-2 cluster archaeon]MBC2747563.1 DUF3467 domain-containing protein [ANME-2 cluster archaeon]
MSNESNEITEEEQLSVFRTALFTKIYATNVQLSKTDIDFRIELFNEKFQVEDGWAFHSDGLVILTREAAKKLLINLDKELRAYEKEYGEIKVSDERMKMQYLL